MLSEALLVFPLALLLSGVIGEGVLVIIDAGTVVDALAFTTSGRTKSIKLSGELRLRLDERTTVIAHRLVTSVRVFGEDGKSGGDQDHEEKDKSKSGIVDEVYNTHDTGYNALSRVSIM